MAPATLDVNERAFLSALLEDDPLAENWTAAWRVGALMEKHGGDAIVAASPEGAFSVAKRLYSRKLLDKQEGRASVMTNGYSLNEKGKEAIDALDGPEETDD